jgi:TonB-linked SusC/RagA family outer membrane protein
VRIRRLVRALSLAGAPLLLAASTAFAQTGQVTGIVTEQQSGQPLAAVQVTLTGTTFGTQTGPDGRYTIANAPSGVFTVSTRRIGYAPAQQENVRIVAGQTTTVNFALNVTTLRLEQVVITGTVDPTSGTRAPMVVDVVSAPEVPPTGSPVAALQGKVAGAQLVSSGGQPGSGISVQLRTPTSISKANEPLYVIDGVILGAATTDLESLDIESIEIVKGAAAASLYGSRAAAGVVNIRTRRGSNLEMGRTRFGARSEIGTASMQNMIKLNQSHWFQTNAQGQFITSGGAAITDPTSLAGQAARALKPLASRFADSPYPSDVPLYDHIDRFVNPGQTYSNTMNLSSNSAATNFFAQLNQLHETGILNDLNDGYDRYSGRLNLDHRLSDKLGLSASVFHSRADRDEIPGRPFFDIMLFEAMIDLAAKDPSDSTHVVVRPQNTQPQANPLYVLSLTDNRSKRVRTLASMETRWSPINALSIYGNLSYDQSDRTTTNYTPRGLKSIEGVPGIGSMSKTQGTTNAANFGLGATYLQAFGSLTTRTTGRILLEREVNNAFTASGSEFTVVDLRSLDALSSQNISNSDIEARSNSYFINSALDFDGRYILDALVRNDQSSLFGPDNRSATYYAVRGAWRLAEESWWAFPSLNEFKLRYAVGTAGGRPSFSDQYETYSVSSGRISKGNLGNRELKPEFTIEHEMGLDLIALNRYSMQLTYARSKTSDQLLLVPLSSQLGFGNQWRNAGTMEGNTWELTTEAQLVQGRDTRWSVGLVADRSRYEITEFNLPCFSPGDGNRNGNPGITRRCEGVPLSNFYGKVTVRQLDQLAPRHDIAAVADRFAVNDEGYLVAVGAGGSFDNPQWGTNVVVPGLTGNITYGWGLPVFLKNAAGVDSSEYIGDGSPDANLGLSTNFSWRALSLYGLITSQIGGQIYNGTKQWAYRDFLHGDVDQRGKPEANKKPLAYYAALYKVNDINDYFVEPGGHTKLRELSARYNLRNADIPFLERLGMENASIGIIGRNLYTWTKYSGFDPEVARGVNSRDDLFGYPNYRTFTGVFEITF